MKRGQAHSLTLDPYEEVHRIPKQVHSNDPDIRSTTTNYTLNKHITRMKSKRNEIRKMAFLLLISPTTTQRGYRLVIPMT